LPGDPRLDSKLLPKEVVRHLEVAEDIAVVGTGLISGDHSAVNQLELLIRHQDFYLVLKYGLKVKVEPFEEGYVSVSKGELWVLVQLLSHASQDAFDPIVVILIKRGEPSCIHV